MEKSSFTQKDLEILEEHWLYQGFFSLKELKCRFKRFEGGFSDVTTTELLVRDPVIGVLLHDPILNKVILIEQFRPGCYQDPQPWLLEIVAGIIDPGESAEQSAHRETQEEAGLTINELSKIFDFWPSPGGSTEHMTLYYGVVDAQDAGGIFGAKHESENIKVHVLECEAAFALLNQNLIRNASTIIALQWLQSQV